MDAASGKVIADMSGENRRQVVLKGGKGGNGNMHYATATMQVPKYAQPGQPAQELEVRMELKVIADVGLVGFPNVGKSTLLSRVTNAEPKIANYHFTTLSPNLGVVDLEGCSGFVIADIPGLIEGASEGVGLGHEFLRHIERTRVMIHVVDVASTEGRDPVDDINKINKELEAYNPEIAKRPQIIAANKTDAIYVEEGEEDPVERLKKEFEPKGIPVYPISAVSGKGLNLVDDYGLSYYAAFAGCSAESEASFETVSFLAKKVDELGLPCVLTIEGKNHKLAETIVQSTAGKNQKVLTMDSMQSMTSKDAANGATYISAMEQNLSVLKEALG